LKKKILIITYYWPPSGGSGVQRWMYFAKYLGDFGYDPIVLTVHPDSASYKNTDLSFSKHVSHIKTYTTKTLEPLKMYSLLATGSATQGIPHGHVGGQKKGILNKIATYVRGNFFIPDARVGWNRFAIPKALEIVQIENIDTVITTGPPHSTHLIGLAIKEQCKVTWIADLRDPWAEIFYIKDLMRTKQAEARDANYEAQVINKADKILTIGQKLKELLVKKLPDQAAKFHHIYNGYDAELLASVECSKHSHFQLAFIGVLGASQPYQSVITALAEWLTESKADDVHWVFAGNTNADILEDIRQQLPQINIEYKGYISHAESVGIMKSSQLLFNFLAEQEASEILISGKQMEYIATGNPILTIGNTHGEAAMLMKDLPNANVFEKSQIAEIKEFISLVYAKWKNGEPLTSSVDTPHIKTKSRYETTKQLASFLDTL
jgi:glycosyltransferase involved in cell wall biosynthesis